MKKRVRIQNGRVVDPAQAIDRITNLYIEDGKISAITDESFNADVLIDATGSIVCPGFIDIHMHEDDYDPETDTIGCSMAKSALHMGVTLDIGGNCGQNVFDPAHYLACIDRDGAPVHLGLLVGHTYLRSQLPNHNKYQPIDQVALKKITAACAELLACGCLGVSFGVKYVPGTTMEEMLALAALCRNGDKLVAAHVRQDLDEVFPAADELAAIGEKAGVRVQFSHIGSMGGYGQMPRLLKQIKDYRAKGIDMLCDCYPYSAFSTGIGETTYDDGFLDRYQANYDRILIASGPYAGKRCTKEIFDTLRSTAPDTATVGYFMNDTDIETALCSPLVMLGSDGVRTGGMGHPRASGSFARFIADYIRPGKIGLAEGISKMTTMTANRLHLPNKGNFLPGSDADITIFDLEQVNDCATYENGQIPAQGFKFVLLGGEIALQDDQIVNCRLGKSVRK